jgi:hypothetical protein
MNASDKRIILKHPRIFIVGKKSNFKTPVQIKKPPWENVPHGGFDELFG